MLKKKSVLFDCIISCAIVVCCCYGKPVADPQESLNAAKTKAELAQSPNPDKIKVQRLYNLLNESLVKETVSIFGNIQKRNDSPNLNSINFLNSESQEGLFTSKPFIENDDPGRDLEKGEEEQNGESSPLDTKTVNGQSSGEQSGPDKQSLVGPSMSILTSQERSKESSESSTFIPVNNDSSLKFNRQRPTFAGQLSCGQLGQLVPPGKPWPANPPPVKPVLGDRFKETTPVPSQTPSTTRKSPLEYNPQRPTFAGQFSSGQLGQLIPPGKPWPADPPAAKPVLEDRFKETTPTALQSPPTTSKSPLEYNPQKPTFAGQFSSGQLGQLIPPGKPWPANPPVSKPVLEDRFKETTPASLQPVSTTRKSPLEYNPQRPTFAGQFSSGQLGQLIPPGKPLPADPPVSKPILEDRFKETTPASSQPLSTTTKSPLEYNPQRPTFAGQFSNGQLGQLIPPGKPLPADPPVSKPILEDRFKETTPASSQPLSTTTKSPLEYNPQRPTFAGQFSNGQLGQLIPPGKPWPADPPVSKPVLEDRFKETTPASSQPLSTTTKSPLEYNPQKPTFAGQFSSGHLGQLIPPGKPWPADTPAPKPVLEDRFKETTPTASQSPPTTSKSPLEYNPQRPTFAGELSSGHLGQLIPSGNPLPAAPPIANPLLEDRIKETTVAPSNLLLTTSKSPLEYKPQKPTFAGELSSGHLGQLIPSGNPLPADPKKIKETTFSPSNHLPITTVQTSTV